MWWGMNGWKWRRPARRWGFQTNRLCYLDTSDVTNRSLARHSFPKVTGGSVVWEYDFDWTCTR